MKIGHYKFNLTKKSVEDFNKKYGFDKVLLFKRIDGSLIDSIAYKEYRAIQKQILNQILTINNLEFDSKKLIRNMSWTYEDEDIQILFHDWIPEITVLLKKEDKFLRASLVSEHAEIETTLFFS